MIRRAASLFTLTMGLALTSVQPALGQDFDFGDDDSPFARDGECDDNRFEGPGMTSTPLLDSDVGHDATDCRIAYDQGRLTFKGAAAPSTRDASRIQWGDDNGQWSRDGECDDMRFEGPGMTTTPLLEEDVMHDATDCRTAYEQGRLDLRGTSGSASAEGSTSALAVAANLEPVRIEGEFDWGDNSSEWAGDGECDDLRFLGAGMSSVPLPEDIGRDEQDCRSLYTSGTLGLNPLFQTPDNAEDIIFGTNTSSFANDGECDDLRFTGAYASRMIYLTDDVGTDADDCRAAVQKGEARWQADRLPLELGQTLELDGSEAAADAEAAMENPGEFSET